MKIELLAGLAKLFFRFEPRTKEYAIAADFSSTVGFEKRKIDSYKIVLNHETRLVHIRADSYDQLDAALGEGKYDGKNLRAGLITILSALNDGDVERARKLAEELT